DHNPFQFFFSSSRRHTSFSRDWSSDVCSSDLSTLPQYQDRPCNETTKVFKYDGSRQCENNGIPLDVMAQELIGGGVDVICSQKSSNGMAYPAVCGAGTGAINVYLIHQENLSDAEALGFSSVNELPNYLDTPCH